MLGGKICPEFENKYQALDMKRPKQEKTTKQNGFLQLIFEATQIMLNKNLG